jgi:hypothetical protein
MTQGKKNHFLGGISMLKWYYRSFPSAERAGRGYGRKKRPKVGAKRHFFSELK